MIMWSHNQQTIANLEKSAENSKVISPESAPSTNQCEACALIKAHKLISRRPGYEETADRPFQRTGFDLIPQHEGYNENNRINPFTCFHLRIKFVYIHREKNGFLNAIKEFLPMMKTRYQQIVRFFRMNDEQTLGGQFNILMNSYDIITERITPYSPNQIERIERYEGVFFI